MPSPSLNQRVAEEIRAWMARRRVSGVKLAQHMGHSNAYLSVRLRSQVMFDLGDLELIAQRLDVPVTVFFVAQPASSSLSSTSSIPSSGSLEVDEINYSYSRYTAVDMPLGIAA